MKRQVYALQIAEGIRISECTLRLNYRLLFSDSDELFYELSENKFLYLFNYGVACFYNFAQSDIEKVTNDLLPYTSVAIQKGMGPNECASITINGQENQILGNEIHLAIEDTDYIRLVMLNTSQSVALDVYGTVASKLLEETREHTTYLERKGKLDITGKKLKRYIAKVLNIKNKISENLYIFDSPDVTWDAPALDNFNIKQKNHFDLKDRSRRLHEQLDIIKENLDLFKDIMFHRESSTLEWIIIILIVIEVIDLFVLKASEVF